MYPDVPLPTGLYQQYGEPVFMQFILWEKIECYKKVVKIFDKWASSGIFITKKLLSSNNAQKILFVTENHFFFMLPETLWKLETCDMMQLKK